MGLRSLLRDLFAGPEPSQAPQAPEQAPQVVSSEPARMPLRDLSPEDRDAVVRLKARIKRVEWAVNHRKAQGEPLRKLDEHLEDLRYQLRRMTR